MFTLYRGTFDAASSFGFPSTAIRKKGVLKEFEHLRGREIRHMNGMYMWDAKRGISWLKNGQLAEFYPLWGIKNLEKHSETIVKRRMDGEFNWEGIYATNLVLLYLHSF